MTTSLPLYDIKQAQKQLTPFLLILIILFSTINVQAQHHRTTPLEAPGNQVFGAIQETISALEADQDTDWGKVEIEALRQHLLDMKAFTEEVETVDKQAIDQGIRLEVRPLTDRAQTALKRVFSMHPAMLEKEKGWTMETQHDNGTWIIRCTTADTSDVVKIRALGYIGLLAAGAHHQQHHWMIATGKMEYPRK